MNIRLPFGIAISVGEGPRPKSARRGPASATATVFPSGYIGATPFEALNANPARVPIPAGAYTWGLRHSSYHRDQLSQMSRYLFDNSSAVAYVVGQIADYACPVVPQAATADRAWNRIAEEYFSRWSRRCDWKNRPGFTLTALQRVISMSVDLDGDIGVAAVRDGDDVKIQLVESYRIRGTREKSGAVVNPDGIVSDDLGRITAYTIDAGVNSNGLQIPADQMILLMEPSLEGQCRGLSALRRGMNDIRDANEVLAFEKLAAKVKSSMPGYIEGGHIDDTAGLNIDGEEPPDDATAGEKSMDRMDLIGGDVPVLQDGQKFVSVAADRPNMNVADFVDVLAGRFAAGLGIPPAYLLDSKLTGPNQRSVMAKAQRVFWRRQELLESLTEWLWVRVIGDAISRRLLPSMTGWDSITCQYPPDATIDAGREIAQEREDVKARLVSRQKHFSKRGLDHIEQTERMFDEDRYIIDGIKRQAEETGVDVKILLARWGFSDAVTSTEDTSSDNHIDTQTA